MRFIVLRPEPQASAMATALAARGIAAVAEPMLRIVAEPAPLAIMAAALEAPDALAVTSAQSLRVLAGQPGLSEYLHLPLFAVGATTADLARAMGFADVRSTDGDAARLAEVIAAASSRRILHLCGRDQAGDLSASLGAAGKVAARAVLYRAEFTGDLSEAVRLGLQKRTFDGLIVASNRTAQGFVNVLQSNEHIDLVASMVLVGISAAAAAPLSPFCARTVIAAAPNGESLFEATVALATAN